MIDAGATRAPSLPRLQGVVVATGGRHWLVGCHAGLPHPHAARAAVVEGALDGLAVHLYAQRAAEAHAPRHRRRQRLAQRLGRRCLA